MSENIKEYIDILISLEPVVKKAGELAINLRKTAAHSNKSATGNYMIDIVTEADLAVQEMIISEMAKTKLIDCQLIAEENTPSVSKFKGTNEFFLTIDPIDGTYIYTSDGRLFSIIISFHDGSQQYYTYYHYPVVNWSRRITDKVEDFGNLPKVNIKAGLDLSKTISYSYGNPEEMASEVYKKLVADGYIFRKTTDITDESGSTTLLFLNQTAGYYCGNPMAYDCICAHHYGKVMGYKVYSCLDISTPIVSDRGTYYPGWYLVLRA